MPTASSSPADPSCFNLDDRAVMIVLYFLGNSLRCSWVEADGVFLLTNRPCFDTCVVGAMLGGVEVEGNEFGVVEAWPDAAEDPDALFPVTFEAGPLGCWFEC